MYHVCTYACLYVSMSGCLYLCIKHDVYTGMHVRMYVCMDGWVGDWAGVHERARLCREIVGNMRMDLIRTTLQL